MASQRGRREKGDEWKMIREYIAPAGRKTANITGLIRPPCGYNTTLDGTVTMTRTEGQVVGEKAERGKRRKPETPPDPNWSTCSRNHSNSHTSRPHHPVKSLKSQSSPMGDSPSDLCFRRPAWPPLHNTRYILRNSLRLDGKD